MYVSQRIMYVINEPWISEPCMWANDPYGSIDHMFGVSYESTDHMNQRAMARPREGTAC